MCVNLTNTSNQVTNNYIDDCLTFYAQIRSIMLSEYNLKACSLQPPPPSLSLLLSLAVSLSLQTEQDNSSLFRNKGRLVKNLKLTDYLLELICLSMAKMNDFVS